MPVCLQEYIEREDEFDINPRETEADNGGAANGSGGAAAVKLEDAEEEDVDVLGEDPNFREDPYLSDGDAAAAAGKPPPLRHLPIEVQRQEAPAAYDPDPSCCCLTCVFLIHKPNPNMYE